MAGPCLRTHETGSKPSQNARGDRRAPGCKLSGCERAGSVINEDGWNGALATTTVFELAPPWAGLSRPRAEGVNDTLDAPYRRPAQSPPPKPAQGNKVVVVIRPVCRAAVDCEAVVTKRWLKVRRVALCLYGPYELWLFTAAEKWTHDPKGLRVLPTLWIFTGEERGVEGREGRGGEELE
ncbi:hypothetical protein AAFF_G00078720 [Aldrovandia affinis]|uniref:Uncharacterized protein n=1 Tax=Aldrovandia affinis TaxID=143900 RepID=A0AAD7WCF3_9TELE|nr:hypothetical protein AAFF_G00078720 [Aldrovandia affinis]